MNTKTQVIEALEACDSAFAAWQIGQIPGRPDDILALKQRVLTALHLLRSLPEQGEGPYMVKFHGTYYAVFHAESPDAHVWRAQKQPEALSFCQAINAAFNAGRLSAQLQQGEPISQADYEAKVSEVLKACAAKGNFMDGMAHLLEWMQMAERGFMRSCHAHPPQVGATPPPQPDHQEQ